MTKLIPYDLTSRMDRHPSTHRPQLKLLFCTILPYHFDMHVHVGQIYTPFVLDSPSINEPVWIQLRQQCDTAWGDGHDFRTFFPMLQ